MRLKRIKLHGFKSFGEATILEIIDGITAIVGPNGCGKSNIADGLRWALGEQSAKSLRGGRMQDVIFAGSAKHKPLNVAQVSVTFTDVHGSLPIDYEEVTLTRKHFRSGESEYLINKHRVRLKEIHSLLMDSGIGKSAFSIFEQGKVDQVIHMTPYERRTLFEEAAGILRYLKRKQESLEKLQAADQNIDRLSDLLREIESRLQILEQQAIDAKLYKESKEQIEQLERGILVAQYDQLGCELERIIRQKEENEASLGVLKRAEAEAESNLSALREEMSIKEGEEKQLSAEVAKLESSIQLTSREIAGSSETMEQMGVSVERWQRQKELLLKEREGRLQETAHIQEEVQRVQTGRTEHEAIVKKRRGELSHTDKAYEELRKRQGQLQQKQLHLTRKRGDAQNELTRLQTQVDASLKQSEELSQKISSLRSGLNEKKKEELLCIKSLSDSDKEFAGLENQRAEAKKWVEEAKAAQEEKSAELHESKKQLHSLEARRDILGKLKAAYEGFSRVGKELLTASENPSHELFGLIHPLYEKLALESMQAMLMEPYEQTLLVETEADLEKVLSFAKEKGLSGFTLFCRERSCASSLASHFLDPIRQIDEVIWIDSNQVIHLYAPKEGSPFQREAELHLIDRKMEKELNVQASIQQQLEAAQQRHEKQKELLRGVEENVRRFEMKRMESQFALQNAQRECQRIDKDLALLEKEKKNKEHQISQNKERMETVHSTLQEVDGTAQDLENELDALAGQLGGLKTDKERLVRALGQATAELNRLIDLQRNHAHAISLLNVKQQEAKTQIERLDMELKQSGDRENRFIANIKEWKVTLVNLEKDLLVKRERHTTLAAGIKELKRSFQEQEVALKKAVDASRKEEKKSHQFDLGVTQKQSVRSSLAAEFLKLFEEEIDDQDRRDCRLAFSVSEAVKLIHDLKRNLQDESEINMASISEFETEKERFSSLSTQLQDLQTTKKELIEVIGQLDKTSRTIFRETFDEIRGYFQTNFSTLFNGGEADIRLTGGGDLLEAGIEIIAQPPGKKMQSIQLLSGGEKCLTALALLFAFFEVKPAPFCVLDEIDAPLDDSNIDRFVQMLKRYTDRCQFLIVTHNKRTMAIADVLIGVSMQEQGLSKVVSLDFSKPKALALA